MGGLVVKKVYIDPLSLTKRTQALIDAHNDRAYARVLKNVKSIIFFGTPHRGADLASLLSNLLFVSFARRMFVEQLRVNSDLIQGINDQFRDRSESLELVSFYESKEMRGLGVYTPNYL
jgi:triacylglycerol esterase/lipase EstA (alpha/beta hydrolase family)